VEYTRLILKENWEFSSLALEETDHVLQAVLRFIKPNVLVSGLELNTEIKGAVGSVALQQFYLGLNLKLAGQIVVFTQNDLLTLPLVARSLELPVEAVERF